MRLMGMQIYRRPSIEHRGDGTGLPGANERTERWLRGSHCRLDGCLNGGHVGALPSAERFEGFHPVTTSAQGAAANSRLRNCFHIDVFGRNLARRIKWGLAAVDLTISATRAKAEYRVNVGDVFEIAGIRADFRIVGPSPFPACHTSRFGCSFASFGLAAITGMSGPR
jgi:hypothetical protein